MRGLVFNGEAPELRDDLPIPARQPNEALIRIRRAGICRTDLEILEGYMGFRGVMGHEFVGEVVEGPATWRGKRVVGEINCSCGECDSCSRGMGNHCPHRTVLGIAGRDGVFAEYAVLPEYNLHEVPRRVSDDQAVFVEPLAAALEIPEQVSFDGTQSVLVLGDGRLGLLCAIVLKDRCDFSLLVGKHDEKLRLGERYGLETGRLEDFDAMHYWDVVVDATGRAEGFDLAMRAVRPRGTIVLKSTIAAEGGMNLAPLVIDEVTVIGSRCGPFDPAIDMLSHGLELSDLITKRFDLSRGLEALRAAAGPGQVKVVLDVD
jgi:threonine dehydrogenase-like Zn-dependent dehydrogenase